MTIEEYKEKLKEIEIRHQSAKKDLAMEFAFNNQKYNISDKITHANKTIIVQKVKWGYCYGSIPSSVVYVGVWLKKDGTPNKKNEQLSFYQSELIN